VGSIRRDGVLFICYPDDHAPPHVHASTGEATVILDLREDGDIILSDRKDKIRPVNAQKSDVRKALRTAEQYFDELINLWEKAHAQTPSPDHGC
jgi:hypothetical protein